MRIRLHACVAGAMTLALLASSAPSAAMPPHEPSSVEGGAIAAAVAEAIPDGPSSQWNFPASPGGYYNLDQRLTILNHTASANIYWAHQFGFVGGDGGYLGLQVGSYPNDTKIALFSIWGANGASGANCGTFVEGAPGYTCRLDPFNWVQGRTYRLRIWVTGEDSLGDWWGAWVQDTTTGTDTQIGRIRVPKAWGWLKPVSMSWTEQFGVKGTICDENPWGYAHFAWPTANNGSVSIATHSHHMNPGDCPAYSRVVEYAGDLQEIGKVR